MRSGSVTFRVSRLKGLEGLGFIDVEMGGASFALSLSENLYSLIDGVIYCILIGLGTVSIILSFVDVSLEVSLEVLIITILLDTIVLLFSFTDKFKYFKDFFFRLYS